MHVGIEALSVYGGLTYLDVQDLMQARGLDEQRFQNLLLREKTVAFPFEDPITFAVNAAQPVVAELSPAERNRIELLIVATESGLDFGKAMSTYVHHYLELNRHCRTVELKHACYAGTAGLQLAASFVLANTSPGAKALVITTDVARPIPHTYAEPSQGAAAVAMLVSDQPTVLRLETGAMGYYGYEVMDSCRPTTEIETGDADLSLLSYLDCIEQCFREYCRRVGEVDLQTYFDYLAFHAPFGGLAKGAHRTLLRKLKRLPPAQIEEDFRRRLEPSLAYCRRIGNIYSGSVFLALAGLLTHGQFLDRRRIGLFSYGSGCCSEFYSGLADAGSQRAVAAMELERQLDERHRLSMEEYDRLLTLNRRIPFGTQHAEVDFTADRNLIHRVRSGRKLLGLQRIANYHREYQWI